MDRDPPACASWTRWKHPVAERAEATERARDEFGRLHAAREQTIARLRPRLDALITEFEQVGWSRVSVSVRVRVRVRVTDRV